MRYLVKAECIDVRTGRRFEPGELFTPDPDEDQAARLIRAQCLKPISDQDAAALEAPPASPAIDVSTLDSQPPEPNSAGAGDGEDGGREPALAPEEVDASGPGPLAGTASSVVDEPEPAPKRTKRGRKES